MNRPTASLSLDLDNLWAYQKTHGDAGWEDYPSYFDVAVPRILNVLDDLKLTTTFFIVGKDAELEKNQGALRLIAGAGHEIANHSLSHEPWFHTYDLAKTEAEVVEAEKAIEAATGIRPRGWRGPGFSTSPQLMELLAQRGYHYDASTFPTFLGPIARLFYFMTGGFSDEDKEQRAGLYGTWKDGFRPLKPFHWNLSANRTLLEIPVTTMPVFRTPIHASYLLYLAKFSPITARLYFRMALMMCKLTGTAPSFLLHPTDFLGKDDVPQMTWFPAMDQLGLWKIQRITEFLSILNDNYRVLPMGDFAKRLSRTETALPQLQLATEQA